MNKNHRSKFHPIKPSHHRNKQRAESQRTNGNFSTKRPAWNRVSLSGDRSGEPAMSGGLSAVSGLMTSAATTVVALAVLLLCGCAAHPARSNQTQTPANEQALP